MIERSIQRVMLGASLMLPVASLADTFEIAVLPDSQFYSELHPEILEEQIDWIVANQSIREIVYVAQLGDLKDDQDCDNLAISAGTGAGRTEWQIVDQAYADLDLAGIPYGVIPGNHDFDQPTSGPNAGGCPDWDGERPLDTYNTVFNPSRFGSFYGDPGTQDGNRVGNSNEDNFTLFDSNGVRFIAINLAYKQAANPVGAANNAELAWADALLKSYPDRLGILTSHYYMDQNPGNSLGPYGQQVYDALANNRNFFMMLSAHKRGEAWATETTNRGSFQPVQLMLSDYQDYSFPDDGNAGTPADSPDPTAINFANITGPGTFDSGFMRRMRFDTSNGSVAVETFIPPVVAIPFKNRGQTLVSTYFPADGSGMDDGTASNFGFSYLGYVSLPNGFDIFECDDFAGGTCDDLIGTIAFPGTSGSQSNGSGITLTYTCNGSFCDAAGYDEGDIQNVSWTINASGDLTAMSMVLDTDPTCPDFTNPVSCSQTRVDFTFISSNLTGNTAQGASCDGTSCISGISTNGANQFTPH